MATTYSFKDLSGAFAHPVAGSFIFAGQKGMSQVTIAMATERTHHDVASDGAVMVSYVSANNGTVAIEVQQTSSLHNFLQAWYNLLKTAAEAGDVSNWASAAITIRNLLDGSYHTLTGVSPTKLPDKVYTAQGQRLVWTLMAANIESYTA